MRGHRGARRTHPGLLLNRMAIHHARKHAHAGLGIGMGGVGSLGRVFRGQHGSVESLGSIGRARAVAQCDARYSTAASSVGRSHIASTVPILAEMQRWQKPLKNPAIEALQFWIGQAPRSVRWLTINPRGRSRDCCLHHGRLSAQMARGATSYRPARSYGGQEHREEVRGGALCRPHRTRTAFARQGAISGGGVNEPLAHHPLCFVGAGAVDAAVAILGMLQGDLVELLTTGRGIVARDAGLAKLVAIEADGAGDRFHGQVP